MVLYSTVSMPRIPHAAIPTTLPLSLPAATSSLVAALKVRMGGIYDPIKGEVVFDSTHCSLYMVVDEDPSKSGLSNAAIFVGIAVAVVAAIAVAIMLYVRKH